MAEFPSDWHRQAHIDALERELKDVLGRRANAEGLLADCETAEKTIRAELDRLAAPAVETVKKARAKKKTG